MTDHARERIVERFPNSHPDHLLADMTAAIKSGTCAHVADSVVQGETVLCFVGHRGVVAFPVVIAAKGVIKTVLTEGMFFETPAGRIELRKERPVLRQGEHDISDAIYFADPCPEPSLSASMAKDFIMGTPLHAWTNSQRLNPFYKAKNSSTFDIGSAFHTLMLSRGANIHVIDAKDYRGSDAKAERDAAYERGDTPLLIDQLEQVEAMEAAARLQLERHPCGDPFKGSDAEIALIWQADGVWNRVKVDQIDRENRVLYDLKSCTGYADPSGWAKTNMNYGIDMRIALYLEGARQVLGGDWRYRVVVTEKDAPHGLAVSELPADTIELGASKIERAREMLRMCLLKDEWPCYPAEVIQPSVAPWYAADWFERQSFEADHKKRTGKDVLEAAFRFQAPEGFAAE